MSTNRTVSIDVQVTDPQALHSHAFQLATTGRGCISSEEATAQLGSAAEPNIGACLRWVFDPGVSPPGVEIQDSSCD